MTPDDFLAEAEAILAEASSEELGLTIKLGYVVNLSKVGVVAGVTMLIRDPWEYTRGDRLLLRGDDWGTAPGLTRRRKKESEQQASELEGAEEALERLREQCAKLADPDVAREACGIPDAGWFGLENVTEFPDVPETDEARQRRAAAIADATSRYDGVAAKMSEVYGFRLPRHLAVFHAFVQSLDPLERHALEFVGRRPGGIMVWFDDGGLELETRDGLDPRLDCRFRCDPAELVTIMWGDSDGLHFGLWYDDPAELPSFVAGNWARDSAETSEYALTPIRTLHDDLEDRLSWGEEDAGFVYGALLAALKAFLPYDDEAVEADGAPRYADAEHPPLLGGIGCALPTDAGDARGGWDASSARADAYRERAEVVDEWIATAREELEAGEPAFAMTLGRELRWFDADDYRDVGVDLLISAYEALDRPELADIVRVHHENRDLRSVGVYP